MSVLFQSLLFMVTFLAGMIAQIQIGAPVHDVTTNPDRWYLYIVAGAFVSSVVFMFKKILDLFEQSRQDRIDMGNKMEAMIRSNTEAKHEMSIATNNHTAAITELSRTLERSNSRMEEWTIKIAALYAQVKDK